jgi:uncharacterized membrane protein
VFFGIVWIGMLYYFNYVQGSFMAEVAEAGVKSTVTQKLVPRALWWFRWGAMWTFVTGLLMLMIRAHADASAQGMSVFGTPFWTNILTGALMGTIMFLNVWLVIWPKQKIVIANAVAVAGGSPANPAAAGHAARAGVASRTNTLFSIPMLFFMLGANHLGYNIGSGGTTVYWILALILTLGIEGNALKGKTGPMTTIKGVITCGFALTAAFILLLTFAV